MASLRSKSVAELQFIIKDAGEAYQALRGNAACEAKYADQVGEARAELLRRQRKPKTIEIT